VSALAGALILAALLVGFGAALALEGWRRRRALSGRERVRRIAFPFTGEGPSEPALAAALRLARAEGATLLPVYLALVPLRLAVEVPLQAECDIAFRLLEAIEQRAARAGVPVDARIERGRTVRHALRELIAHERFERMVVAAGTGAVGSGGAGEGFTPDDVAWLLEHVPGELIALRPTRAKLLADPDVLARAKPSAT
jgi:nucleotide-binding universal stress UspA family protein